MLNMTLNHLIASHHNEQMSNLFYELFFCLHFFYYCSMIKHKSRFNENKQNFIIFPIRFVFFSLQINRTTNGTSSSALIR